MGAPRGVTVPRLIVIKGTDEGRQFALGEDVLTAGRDSSSRIRLTDTEVSRRHAEFVRTPDGFRVRDVGSANGTFVNNQSVRDVLLQPGDHIQIGQTVLVFTLDRGEAAPASDLADKISLITRQDMELSSAIVKTIGETEGSRILAHPEQVEGPWLKSALANLGVMYEATWTISQTLDLEQLLERILELIFKTLEADRGCILLRTTAPLQEGYGAGPDPGPVSSSEFEPKAVRWRDEAKSSGGATREKIPISRTIVDYVLKEKKGILVSDALRDERFQAVQSIVRSGIREVICVPMKGRHQTLGVLYLDTATSPARLAMGQPGKFTGDHLSLAIAIAHQAAMAVEETRYHQALVNAERLAAVGQTIAALSHHIKNIVQNLQSGGDLLRMGIKSMDQPLLQQGWRMTEKNLGKIQDLVMDMLSYSKEREPAIEPTNLNAVVREVVELLAPRAKERGVHLASRLDESLPLVPVDPEGIHRALLNLVVNALEAVDESENPKVVIVSGREPITDPTKGAWVRLQVADNGHGIPADKLGDIFKPFVSSKGARGTGLGLAVSRKILREHGGDIFVKSKGVGEGSVFSIRLPLRSPLGGDSQSTQTEIPVAPPD
jgi:signal transduction histidine kinase/pSer/pThr/pTyr-binding forkhead associated (FHA) protein